jgi:predicted transcriptional regulator
MIPLEIFGNVSTNQKERHMAVKKKILDNFLKPSSIYLDNQKNFQSIFIDKNKNESEPELKLNQSGIKTEPKTSFSSLIGLQREIVLLIHEICQTILEQQTNPLSLDFIATQCKCTKSTARKSIQRLEQKGIILRMSFKNGRGGWTKYQLLDQIYQEIRMLKNQKLEPNLNQNRAKVEIELETELRSNILNSAKTATTELSPEWDIDLANFEKFGFTRSHLRQLISLNKISDEDIKQSLIEFSYDFENNFLPNIKTSKINMLMGLFRAGQTYTSENYRTEQVQLIKLMAERAKKKKEVQFDEKLIAWTNMLTEDEQRKIIAKMPIHLMVSYNAHGFKNSEVKNWISENYGELISEYFLTQI